MRTHLVLLAAMLFVVQGCSVFKPITKGPQPAAEGFGTSRSGDLVVTPAQTSVTIEWGVPAEIPVEVTWAAEQKYAVQIVPATGTPSWLTVEMLPAIIEPPGKGVLRLTTEVGSADLGSTTITLEAAAYGLSQPVRVPITIEVQRQAGAFVPVLAAPVTVECRNVCGRVVDGTLTFYDVLREKGQDCSEKATLPASQRIGAISYPLSRTGFGFGRTCRVAAIFENGGSLLFFNLGIAPAQPRGSVVASVRGASECWLSPDNSVALVRMSGSVVPYDVVTGRQIGDPCRMSGDLSGASLQGTTLTAGSCVWNVR